MYEKKYINFDGENYGIQVRSSKSKSSYLRKNILGNKKITMFCKFKDAEEAAKKKIGDEYKIIYYVVLKDNGKIIFKRPLDKCQKISNTCYTYLDRENNILYYLMETNRNVLFSIKYILFNGSLNLLKYNEDNSESLLELKGVMNNVMNNIIKDGVIEYYKNISDDHIIYRFKDSSILFHIRTLPNVIANNKIKRKYNKRSLPSIRGVDIYSAFYMYLSIEYSGVRKLNTSKFTFEELNPELIYYGEYIYEKIKDNICDEYYGTKFYNYEFIGNFYNKKGYIVETTTDDEEEEFIL